jgi:hypothetical protein
MLGDADDRRPRLMSQIAKMPLVTTATECSAACRQDFPGYPDSLQRGQYRQARSRPPPGSMRSPARKPRPVLDAAKTLLLRRCHECVITNDGR